MSVSETVLSQPGLAADILSWKLFMLRYATLERCLSSQFDTGKLG